MCIDDKRALLFMFRFYFVTQCIYKAFKADTKKIHWNAFILIKDLGILGTLLLINLLHMFVARF